MKKYYVYHAYFLEVENENIKEVKKIIKTNEKNIEVAYKKMVSYFGNKNFSRIEYKYTQYK